MAPIPNEKETTIAWEKDQLLQLRQSQLMEEWETALIMKIHISTYHNSNNGKDGEYTVPRRIM